MRSHIKASKCSPYFAAWWCVALLMLLLACAASSNAHAQTKRPAGKPARTDRRAAQSRTEQRRAEQRRARAFAALRAAAEDATSIADSYDRARTIARVAATLCRIDKAAARTLFPRAWSAAQDADREIDEANPDAASRAEDNTREARDAVVRFAVRCDAALANGFLSASDSTADTPINIRVRASGTNVSPWGEPSASALRRFELARELIDAGARANISPLVAPAIREEITADGIGFLIELRRTDSAAADDLFTRMLRARSGASIAERAAASNANGVLLAAAYISAPTGSASLAVVNANGALQLRRASSDSSARSNASPVSAAARAAFAEFAVAALLTPNAAYAPPGDDAARDAAALFFAAERVLPFFAAMNHPALANLRARRDALAASLDAARREQFSRTANELASSRKVRTDDALRFARERLRSLPEGVARDAERLRLVRVAARRRRWADARRAADDIVDPTTRKHAATLIRTRQIAHLIGSYADEEADDHLHAREFVEASDVPAVWQVWGYAQAAQLASRRRKPEAARELLSAGLTRAESIGTDAADSSHTLVAARALLLVATLEVDASIAPASLAAFVRAINSQPDFDSTLTLNEPGADVEPASDQARADEADAENLLPASVRDPAELFAQVARRDHKLADAEARNIEDAMARSLALVGVARAALER